MTAIDAGIATPEFDLVNRLLQPVGCNLFLASSFRSQPLHLPRAESDVRESVFTWEDLVWFLETNRLEAPRVRLEGEGFNGQRILIPRMSPRKISVNTLDSATLHRYLDEGATLVADDLGETNPRLALVMRALRAVFGVPTQANAYATYRPLKGFGLHWDDHDVLVIQTEGRKHWTIYRPDRNWPLFKDFQDLNTPPTEIHWSGVLERGEALYVPRGWWHDVVAIDEPSLHVTIGFRSTTMVDFASFVLDRLRESEEVREDIHPFDLSRRREQLQALRELVFAELTEVALDDYLEDRRLGLAVRPVLNLPSAILGPDNLADFQLLPSGDLKITCDEVGVHLRRGGRVVHLAPPAMPLVNALSNSRMSLTSLVVLGEEHGLTEDQVTDLVKTLLRESVAKAYPRS